MPTGPSDIDRERIAAALARYRNAPSATSADRAVKDQLLDELQEAVGMGGRMTTERDILRRAETLLKPA